MLCIIENKCVYKAWVAPKSNTESGTQEVIHNDSDVKYRFESCPDYLKLKLKVMKNEKWWNGFLLGFFIGGIIGIIVLDLVQKGIL
jgi:hypothetical protein